MKACKFCSTQVDDAAQRCPSCGSNVFLHICENCGTCFDSAFCPNCGVKAGQGKKVCPECHSIYFSNACPNCGYSEIRKPVQQTIIHNHNYERSEHSLDKSSTSSQTRRSPGYDTDAPTVRSKPQNKGSGCGWGIFTLIVFCVCILYVSSVVNKSSSTSSRWGSTSSPSTYSSRTTARTTSSVTAVPTASPTPDPEIVSAQALVDAWFIALQVDDSSSSATDGEDSISATPTIVGYDTMTDAQRQSAEIVARAYSKAATGIEARAAEVKAAARKSILTVRKAEYKAGRGTADIKGTEPDYVGILGYAAVSDDQKLQNSSDFASTPWQIPTYQPDKQFWQETGSIDHKTPVVVLSQKLEASGRATSYTTKYTGYVQVLRLDTSESCYLPVQNFVTSAYWESDLSEVMKLGFCIAVYQQVSDYYPIVSKSTKAELEGGTMVLLPTKTAVSSSSPDKMNNPITGIVVQQWSKGIGPGRVFFNADDLTLVY